MRNSELSCFRYARRCLEGNARSFCTNSRHPSVHIWRARHAIKLRGLEQRKKIKDQRSRSQCPNCSSCLGKQTHHAKIKAIIWRDHGKKRPQLAGGMFRLQGSFRNVRTYPAVFFLFDASFLLFVCPRLGGSATRSIRNAIPGRRKEMLKYGFAWISLSISLFLFLRQSCRFSSRHTLRKIKKEQQLGTFIFWRKAPKGSRDVEKFHRHAFVAFLLPS